MIFNTIFGAGLVYIGLHDSSLYVGILFCVAGGAFLAQVATELVKS